jgi:hypothetical protein
VQKRLRKYGSHIDHSFPPSAGTTLSRGWLVQVTTSMQELYDVVIHGKKEEIDR